MEQYGYEPHNRAPLGRSASPLPTQEERGCWCHRCVKTEPCGRCAVCDALGLRHVCIGMIDEGQWMQDDGDQTPSVTKLDADTVEFLDGRRE